MIKLCFSLVIGYLLLTMPVQGALRSYGATQDNSVWRVIESSKLECKIRHEIPRYGMAYFSSYAGKKQTMQFDLDMLNLPDAYDLAAVKSVPPSWKPGVAVKDIVDMNLYKQFNSSLPKKIAWTMLTELEQGFIPTFQYNDWYSEFDQVEVALSSVNFRPVYDQFLQCVSNLMPFDFDDIALTVLNYESNTDQLTQESERQINMIREFLLHNKKAIARVEIEAFTDSYGGRWPNLQLSIKRAEAIKQFLLNMGLAESIINAVGQGEKKHIASNQTELGRAENRRVVIRLTQVVEPDHY